MTKASSSYGLGIGVLDIGSDLGRLYGHDGKDFGYLADLYYVEKTGITVALCTNSTGGPEAKATYDQLLDRISALALESGVDGASQGY